MITQTPRSSAAYLLTLILLACTPACDLNSTRCFGGSQTACERLESSCAEDPKACLLAARARSQGDPDVVDRQRSLELYRVACGRYGTACDEMVAAAGHASDDSALAALALGCEKDVGSACRLLAAAPGFSSSPAMDLTLLKWACDREDAISCRLLAERVGPRDGDAALSLADRGCSEGDAAACRLSAALLFRGPSGRPSNFSAGRAALSRGAERGDSVATKLLNLVDDSLTGKTACAEKCIALAGARGCSIGAARCLESVRTPSKRRGAPPTQYAASRGLSICRTLLDDCLEERKVDPIGVMTCESRCLGESEN
jgi:hypothetical protein